MLTRRSFLVGAGEAEKTLEILMEATGMAGASCS